MRKVLQYLFGKTVRERVANVVSYSLLACLIVVTLQLKWALKSPNPAEWNAYTNEANAFLYEALNTAHPRLATVVSHRAGNVPGVTDAPPLDRLNYSYAQGQRHFEMDFSWTADNQLVVKHDWNARSEIPTLEAFLNEEPGKHASLAMVYSWLAEHPDAFIVTDCKKRSLECVAQIRMERPDLVPQFIPQIYQFKDYELVKSQGFRNVILTLYRCLSKESTSDITAFAASHDLFALTIPKKRADDEELISAMQKLCLPVFAHTVNDPAEVASLQIRGVYGVYSDDLNTENVAALNSAASELRR